MHSSSGVASAAEVGEERSEPTPNDRHGHGAGCGHAALVHAAPGGGAVHVGFVVDGDLVCFEPRTAAGGGGDGPNVLDWCLTRAEADPRLLCHPRTDECERDPDECWRTAAATYVLFPVASGDRDVELGRDPDAPAANACLEPLLSGPVVGAEGPTHALGTHEHGDECGHAWLRHDDHRDYLVPDDVGDLVVHHVHADSRSLVASRPRERARLSRGAGARTWSRAFVDGIQAQYLSFLCASHRDAHDAPEPIKPKTKEDDDRPTSSSTSTSPAAATTSVLSVEGVCCGSECPTVEAIANAVPGVLSAKVNVVAKQVIIKHAETDAGAARLASVALTKAGFSARVVKEGGARGVAQASQRGAGAAVSPPGSASVAVEEVTSVLSVEGVCCASECPAVESVVGALPGVLSVKVNVVAKQVLIKHAKSSTDAALLSALALSKAGFPSNVVKDGAAPDATEAARALQRKQRSRIDLPYPNVMLAFVLWLASFASYANPPTTTPIKFLSVVAAALTLPRIAWKGFVSLRRRRVLDINVLMTLAVIGAFAIQDFHEGAAVVVVFALSDWLEARASRRARVALEALVALKPERAVMFESGAEVAVEAVRVGDHLLVRAGDAVPVDAKLVSGEALIDESNLTGESRPVEKKLGDVLSAGTINVGGSLLRVECVRLSEDSAVAKLARLMQEAQSQRSQTEMVVERVAAVYTPIIFLTAILMATVPWAWGAAMGQRWLYTALLLLLVACPCAFVISTPITYVCGLAAAARFGVLIKGGSVLEALASADVLASDKTGTLTRGEFAVTTVYLPSRPAESRVVARRDDDAVGSTVYEADEVDAMAWLGALEEQAVHPMARAVRRRAQITAMLAGGAGAGLELISLETIPGVGIRGTCVAGGASATAPTNTTSVALVGNRCVLDSCSGLAQADRDAAFAWARERASLGETTCFLVVDDVLRAGVSATDQLRAEAVDALGRLAAMGIQPVVLTGDSSECADRVRADMGVVGSRVAFHAGLKPEDKVAWVKRLAGNVDGAATSVRDASIARSCGRAMARACRCGRVKSDGDEPHVVVMIGDGVNDAPALAAATVGVAMGATGSPLAIDTADVALMDNDLGKLPRVFRLARAARRKIVVNIVFSLVLKGLMIGLSVAGFVSLGVAVGVDVGSMLIVTLNSIALVSGSSKAVAPSERPCAASWMQLGSVCARGRSDKPQRPGGTARAEASHGRDEPISRHSGVKDQAAESDTFSREGGAATVPESCRPGAACCENKSCGGAGGKVRDGPTRVACRDGCDECSG